MGVSLPVYVPESPPSGPRRDRRGVLLAALAVALLVLAWIVVFRPSHATVTGPLPNPTAPVPGDIVPLPAGSPTDGLGTKMLPVRVTPAKDLADGQLVTVTGSGFTKHTQVGAVMCTGASRTQGVAACDLTSSLGTATTDGDGTFTMTVPVRRYPAIANAHVDCGTGNVDPDDYAALLEREGPHPTTYNPASATCVVAVGEISNYDNSGGWPVAFAGETFLHGTTTTTAASATDGVAPSTASTAPGCPAGGPAGPTTSGPGASVAPSVAPTTTAPSGGGLTPATRGAATTRPGPVGVPTN